MEDQTEILTHKHKYWGALRYRLLNTLIEYQNGKEVLCCFRDLRNTRKILKSLPGIEVEGSVEYLQKHGACCDCEVIMNVYKI